ncbi:hypothetical protein M2137_001400 [Parabacteroides sp. PFB2-10]|uniref:BF3164 family lipoprotein n=1 Tax=Parabacteroides sp. PFB2-10 TaxID=1742405 RepID=UPI00247390C6|nr:BF3164 family lipoprotein [Parabacteroides sp. PFB2-10]MDH6312625.1 hypothetical protein [Parabacteroides sp. PFB2-10]
MRNTILFLLTLWGLYSCQRPSDSYNRIFPDGEKRHGELFLSGLDNTLAFYELQVTDSFVVFLDFFNDTVLQVYNLKESPGQTDYLLKGNGPEDLNMPFVNKAVLSNKKTNHISLYDLRKQAIGNYQIDDSGKGEVTFEKIPQQLPFTKDINITHEYIFGIDIDQRENGLFYRYDIEKDELFAVAYAPKHDRSYKEDMLPFLYNSNLIVHEEKKRIVQGMLKLNLIQLYDFDLTLKKQLVVGEQIHWPAVDPTYVDLPNATNYFTSICGTDDYVYLLYKGSISSSYILILDWEGNHKKTIETDVELKRITVDKDNRFILGVYENIEGGTDVRKYSLL